eukprot:SAG22_NODE_69_length_22779_cov_71.088139_18_plen_51_part_00
MKTLVHEGRRPRHAHVLRHEDALFFGPLVCKDFYKALLDNADDVQPGTAS